MSPGMYVSRGLILAGAAVTAAGMVFHLQGQSVVGPAESFMYGNPEWVGHGIWIAMVGTAVAGAGAALHIRSRNRRRRGRRA